MPVAAAGSVALSLGMEKCENSRSRCRVIFEDSFFNFDKVSRLKSKPGALSDEHMQREGRMAPSFSFLSDVLLPFSTGGKGTFLWPWTSEKTSKCFRTTSGDLLGHPWSFSTLFVFVHFGAFKAVRRCRLPRKIGGGSPLFGHLETHVCTRWCFRR